MSCDTDNIRPIGIDWASLPYATKSNREIARRLGVNTSTVRYHRRRLGHATHETKQRTIDWGAVAWEGKTNAQVAREVGASVRAVFVARKKLGVPPYSKRGGNGSA